VQVFPLSARGSGTTPSTVNAGDGGQAADLVAAAHGSADRSGMVALGVVGVGALLLLAGRRTASRRARRAP